MKVVNSLHSDCEFPSVLFIFSVNISKSFKVVQCFTFVLI